METGLKLSSKGSRVGDGSAAHDSSPSGQHPLNLASMAITDSGSGNSNRASSSKGTSIGGDNSSSENVADACNLYLEDVEALVHPAVPGLSSVQLSVAELAHLTEPVLKWQLNLWLRKEGVKEAFSFLEGSSRLYDKYKPDDYTVKIKRAIEGLFSSKGATEEVILKAARQWCTINYLVRMCKAFHYPLGYRCFDGHDLLELGQLIQQPEYDDMREAVEIILLIAREIVSAAGCNSLVSAE